MSLMSKVALMLANFNRSLCRLAELPPRSHAPCDSPHGGRTSKCLSCWGCFPSPQGPYTRVPSHHLSLLTTHLNKLSGELGALWHEVTCLLIEKYGKYDWKYVNVNMLVHLCWMCFWFFFFPPDRERWSRVDWTVLRRSESWPSSAECSPWARTSPPSWPTSMLPSLPTSHVLVNWRISWWVMALTWFKMF